LEVPVDRAIGEEAVIACLTGPNRPLDYCFLFQGEISFYAPKVGLILTLRVHDAELAQACRNYLCQWGWAYQTREQLDSHAAHIGWTDWPPVFRFTSPAT
jgi:hypothetical protein